MRAPEGTLISYATQPGSVAQDGGDGHSPYTKALAATIRQAGSTASGKSFASWNIYHRTGLPLLVLSKLFDEAHSQDRDQMKNHVYKVLELVGSSETSIEEAINTAVGQASKTVRNMDWFEVVHTRGHIENGKVGHYQVTLKIGFNLEK